jgi:hypothetical protein
MPIEYTLLKDLPCSIHTCPYCHAQPFEPFMRGLVQRSNRKWFGLGPNQDYCALICSSCKQIVAYESPITGKQVLEPPE